MKPKTRFTFKIHRYGGTKCCTFTTIQPNRESAWKRLWELYALTADQIHLVELASEEPIP